ncbi:hypothetical protein TNCV_265611 [Trichonephila clavipes]|nr:hypothetical protein TNCV_265611 [Trichonephila clavipes]
MARSAEQQKVQDSKCNREFQIWWTEKNGIMSKGDKVVFVLCSGIWILEVKSALRPIGITRSTEDAIHQNVSAITQEMLLNTVNGVMSRLTAVLLNDDGQRIENLL